jgi:hypothetical protein
MNMNRVLGLCLVLGWLPGVVSGADGKQSSSTAKPEPAKERLIPAGQILGEIIKKDEGGKSFTLRMHQKVPQLSASSIYRPGGGCAT